VLSSRRMNLEELSSFWEQVKLLFLSSGVWGHAGNFEFLNPLRCHFLLSDSKFHSSSYQNIVLQCFQNVWLFELANK